MTADLITAALLLIASGMTTLHAFATWRARSGQGASLTATLFFAGLCGWNAINFARLDQPASCAASVLFLAAHILWLALQIRYRRKPADPLTTITILEPLK